MKQVNVITALFTIRHAIHLITLISTLLKRQTKPFQDHILSKLSKCEAFFIFDFWLCPIVHNKMFYELCFQLAKWAFQQPMPKIIKSIVLNKHLNHHVLHNYNIFFMNVPIICKVQASSLLFSNTTTLKLLCEHA